jgi:hypothetical protein
VGGGTGGCAAALAAASLGMKVVITEETNWIGGQLTSQAVPPDEHPWIESFGATSRYREFRNRVRSYYRVHRPLTESARSNPLLNPGGGWVSRLCFEPQVGVAVLYEMLEEAISKGLVEVRLNTRAIRADLTGDAVTSVEFEQKGVSFVVEPKVVVDSTETGSFLPLAQVEYVLGAESQAETGEPHALEGPPDPLNVQGITWCAVLSHDPGSHRVIDKPREYEHWKSWQPENWCGSLLSLTVADPFKGGTRVIPMEGDYGLLTYRQIANPANFAEPILAATSVNWPQNDYFAESILDVPESVVQERLESSRQLTLSLLYWLQTEAGFPGLYLRPDLTGTVDGLAMAPYIRESRRLQAQFTITEKHVSAEYHQGQDRAKSLPRSVGVGAYRLDLHPGTNNAPTVDLGTVPFQIPLGSLLAVRVSNVLAGGKNLGVTHVANGCYRLHPIEWNVGEAAGLLAAFSVRKRMSPQAVNDGRVWTEFEQLVLDQGIETAWPEGKSLRPL